MRRLVIVRAAPSVHAVPVGIPTTVYRRRRAVALLAVVTALAALVLALQPILGPSGTGWPPERPGAPAVYVVQPGDTFWAIAGRLHPGEDPRPLVARLVAAHGSPVLVPGQRLHLPDRA